MVMKHSSGRIASAGLTPFAELDEQTSSRWTRTTITAGHQEFTWNFTANHATRHWRYYITRGGWNPNQPLSRAAFEATPFCTEEGGQQRPPMTTVHGCGSGMVRLSGDPGGLGGRGYTANHERLNSTALGVGAGEPQGTRRLPLEVFVESGFRVKHQRHVSRARAIRIDEAAHPPDEALAVDVGQGRFLFLHGVSRLDLAPGFFRMKGLSVA
jgi:hypothetical protein